MPAHELITFLINAVFLSVCLLASLTGISA